MSHSFTRSFRLKTSFLHLLASIIIAGSFSVVASLFWYPRPLLTIQGGESVFITLIFINTIFGPALTFLVSSPNKSHIELSLDIALIAAFQTIAFIYGAGVIYQERPQYLVFAGTQFFVVKHGEANGNANNSIDSAQRYRALGPKVVYAVIPREHAFSGAALIAGVQGDPTFALDATSYQPIKANVREMEKNALDSDAIREDLVSYAAKSNTPAENFLYFPVKGRSKTAIAIVNRSSGELEDIYHPDF